MSGNGGQQSAAETGARDRPDVLSVCRWLPQPFPSGAFSGRHDLVHVGERQAFVNLWLSDVPVHAGDYVGPPRGGLVPGQQPDYDVAMPAGGYLNVRAGVLVGWSDSADSGQLLRADGDRFQPEAHGPAWPYLMAHYRAMTQDDRLNALATVRRRRLSVHSQTDSADADAPPVQRQAEAQAISDWVAASRQPEVCDCETDSGTPVGTPRRGRSVPGALLTHGGAITTLVGQGTPEEACDAVWRLTRALADPTQAGLVRAAEAAARRSAEGMSGWPDGPLTEEAVALVAAQALRWHGSAVAPQLPFWTLGWIFVAGPVMDALLGGGSLARRERLRRRLLDRADRTRMERVAHTWAAAHSATRDLDDFREVPHDSLARRVEVIDLRSAEQSAQPSADIYRRTVESVVGELAAE